MSMFGGNGGSPFADNAATSNLAKIYIRCGDRVDYLQCEYEDGSHTDGHGGQGGHDEQFILTEDEAIITIWIWSGLGVDAIQFQTTKGRVSPKYGGGGGDPHVIRGNDGTTERALMGFKGRCGQLIDALQPLWSDTRVLGMASAVVGQPQGGMGGGDFDELTEIGDPFQNTLKAIVVRCGEEIDSVQCRYYGTDRAIKSTSHNGGNGGGEQVFELNDGERIIRVEGRSGDRIDRLQFFTNQNRQSNVYGGQGGGFFAWTPPYPGTDTIADVGMSLLCFQGKCGERVDRLAPVWAVDPPVSFDLVIDSFDQTQLQSDSAQPEQAWSDSKVVENKTQDNLSSKFSWTMEASKTTTISLSTASRTKLGSKFTAGVTAGGKAGVPFVTEGEVKGNLGIEVSKEKEWGDTISDGKAITRRYQRTSEEVVTIRPNEKMVGKAVAYTVALQNVKWTGKMVVTYAGGATRSFDVDGTFDSASATKCHTSYSAVAIQ